jgi:hypothetical protein
MRYWGDLDGEKLTDEAWGETKVVKEFSHIVRTFENKLPEGSHTIGPFRLDFQGREYESNSLSVRVLPAPGTFRGIRAYFPENRGAVGKNIQLVVYEYRDDEDSLHKINLRENLDFEVYPHGGYIRQDKGHGGRCLWIQMEYFTIVPRSTGTLSITSESFQNLNKKTVIPASLTVLASEKPSPGQPAPRMASDSESSEKPTPEAGERSK